MKAIGDLGGLRRPRCGASGIVLGTVTGNDFDSGMVTQPGRDRLGRALRQERNGPTVFEIHQDRAIDPALAERKIIDAEHMRGRLGGCRGTAENTEDSVATERHPQASGHPCAGFTT
jgi:hypothetical protein